jgi:phosphoribosyl 1,2-cyclic phosphate phosphodiesterase
MHRFFRGAYRYIFDAETPLIPGTSRPSLDLREIHPGERLRIGAADILPLPFEHGHLRVLGFRVGTVAYLTDIKSVPEEVTSQLLGLDVLVLNALWWRPHPTHQSIPEAIATARALGAKRTILTHLTHETGHAELAAALPPGIEPGYDGLTIEVPE